MTADSDDHSFAAAQESRKGTSTAADSLRSQAGDFVEQQKAAGADQIGRTAEALDAAASNLQGSAPKAAEYVHDLAGRLDAIADNLREQGVDEIIGKATDFARQQPVVFFAGAVATGFALSRFLKSSSGRGA